MMHEIPDLREREGLLEETWETAVSILKDRNLSDEDALDYAGLTVAGGIVLTHPFQDGNGRTSRVLSYVMMRGTEAPGELRDILAQNKGGSSWNVTPDTIQIPTPNRTFSGNQPDHISWESNHWNDADDAFGGKLTSSVDKRDNVLREFIEHADETIEKLVAEASVSDESGVTLDGDKLIKLLASSETAASYAQELAILLRKEKQLPVQGFLAGMKYASLAAYPDKLEQRIAWAEKKDKHNSARRGKAELAKRALTNGTMTIRDQNVALHRFRSDIYDK